MSDAAAFTTAANIQGALHIGAPLGRRKQKLKKAALATLYVNRPVLNAPEIIAWAKANGFTKTVTPDDMHVTVAFSRAEIEWLPPSPLEQLVVPPDDTRTIARFGPEKDCIVLCFDYPELKSRWRELRDAGASWDWPDYQPHITLSYNGYNANDLTPSELKPYAGPIVLGQEEFDEVTEGWGDNIVEKAGARHSKTDRDLVQNMHDHSVALGASCGVEKRAPEYKATDARIAKVDEGLGLVFGYAVVCKINGEDYFDLNLDKRSDGTVERVPEHIPEDAMLKAAADFMQTARAGNEMHSGPDVGSYVFAFPLTTEIAKAFGITTPVTGLMVAFKPSPEVLAKYKSGEYTGFSIEGSRVKSEEIA